MQITEKLRLHAAWKAFLDYKIQQGSMPRDELEALQSFVEQKAYSPVVERILKEERFSTPEMKELNKLGTGKKRIVFVFPQEENFVLKVLAFLLRNYEAGFAGNLYSFRASRGVKGGIHSILQAVNMENTYSYKADVHDYFNSIDSVRMIEILKEKMPGEEQFITLFDHTLNDPYAFWSGQMVKVRKGVMAGMPVSGFLANLYLSNLDEFFEQRDIPYIRYSDDIVVFAQTEDAIHEYETVIKTILAEKGLTINTKKEIRTVPGEMVEFLGFSFYGHTIDLAPVSITKIKGKLHRKARALYRWKLRKNVPDACAVRAYIKFLNRKFYDNPIHSEITWARWYFPFLTDDTHLKEIDDYALSCMRYITTGNYSRKSYSLRYQTIKQLGFQSLVNSYWRFHKGTYDSIQNESSRL